MHTLRGSAFLATLLTPLVCALAPLAALHAETHVRIVTANLTSGNGQDYSPGHGARILQGLKPDVVLIQEFNIGDGSETALRQWVNQTFGQDFNVWREEQASKGLPNGIISRFPIISKGEWKDSEISNRDFAWAQLGLPGNRKLWAISVHLSHEDKKKRAAEAAALAKHIQDDIPAADLVVLGGDFNTKGRKETCIENLSKVLETGAPYPADDSGNETTNEVRKQPYDWLLADKDLQALMVPVKIGEQAFAHGWIFDSHVVHDLSSLVPVQADDSHAKGMQHLPIIKDFLLP